MNVYEVLRRPLITEKTTGLRPLRAYTFEVHPHANKLEVKQAVENIFEVSVVSVNVINVPAKRRRAGRRWIVRQAPRRKAVVKLAWGSRSAPSRPGRQSQGIGAAREARRPGCGARPHRGSRAALRRIAGIAQLPVSLSASVGEQESARCQ